MCSITTVLTDTNELTCTMNSTHLPASHSRCLPKHYTGPKRPRHVPIRLNAITVTQDAHASYARLCDFIKHEGGFVHSALHVDSNTGGIVAAQDVAVVKGSLVELPLSIRLTTEVAQELLLPALNAAGLPTMSLLDETQQLALAVAWLRKQSLLAASQQSADSESAATKWQPYISSMPGHVPCGWAKTEQQLAADYDAFLQQHGLDQSWWKYFVAQVAQQMQEQAEQLSSQYSKALGVTAGDILWALGQVTARKVVVDNQVLLEPWSDLLRHPPSGSSSSSGRCEIQWSYGLNRSGTSVVSRGAGRRIAADSSSSSSDTAAAVQQQDTAADSAAHQQQQQQPELLLTAGEELWASRSTSSSSGGNSTNELFGLFISKHGHLAPLAWYLQHGGIPQGLAGVRMRTSDILDSWRLTIEAESSATPPPGSSSSSSKSQTVLWDYLTQQYQQDALTVLAATPKQHQQEILQWLLKPVMETPAESVAEATDGASAGGRERIRADVDPLPMIGVLDELLLAAIDAADEDAE